MRLMKPAVWRGLILVFCAVVAAVAMLTILDFTGVGGAKPWLGLWGDVFGASSQTYHIRVTVDDPGGPSDRGGLRQGDLIDVRTNSVVDRFREVFGQPLAGQPITLAIQRGGLEKRVTVVPSPLTVNRWDVWVIPLSAVWLVLFAALIAWRRPYVQGNLLLSTALAGAAAGVLVNENITGGTFAAPWTWLYVTLGIGNVAWPVAVAVVPAYASSFAWPLSSTRRYTQLLCYLLVALSVAVVVADVFGLITLSFDPLFLLSPAGTVPVGLAVLTASACCVLAISASSGVDRQRAAWSLVPLAGFILAWMASGIAQILAPTYAIYTVGSYFSTASFTLTPVVLTYVALNRRLIDIGFVLNRALVYTLVSTIVI